MINIVYRLCEAEMAPPFRSKRLPWFSKLNCLKSFLDSVEFSNNYIASVTFIHDGPEGQLIKAIPEQFKVIKVNACSNEGSLLATYEAAKDILGDIYYVEDDYLHLPESIKLIALALPGLGLVTGYDHEDRYVRDDDLSFGKEMIAFDKASNRHWRTAESTTCTFAISEAMRPKVELYARDFMLQDRKLFRKLYKKKIRLWTPVPGLTTHVDTALAPGFDWSAFNDQMTQRRLSQV
jgi:hypothetical protein